MTYNFAKIYRVAENWKKRNGFVERYCALTFCISMQAAHETLQNGDDLIRAIQKIVAASEYEGMCDNQRSHEAHDTYSERTSEGGEGSEEPWI